MKRLEALLERRNALAGEANTIRDQVRSHMDRDDDPSDEEVAEFRARLERGQAIPGELATLDDEIRQVRAVVDAPPQAREVISPTVMQRADSPFTEGVEYGPVDQVRGAARTAVETLPVADDEVRAALYRTLERADDPSGRLARHMIAASRPAYRTGWQKLISGRSWALTPEEGRAVDHVRAASLTDAAGGFAVPTVLDPTLIVTGTHDGMTPNPIRQLANVRQITGDNLNLVTTAGVTASYVAEATEGTDGAPTLAQLTLTPYKAHLTIPFSIEISQDWAGMEADLRALMLIARDDLELEKFTLGTGVNQPLGLVYDLYTNYAARVQASATADTFAKADVYATIAKVADRYRQRGSWIGNELLFDKVRQFDTSGGADLWVQLAADRPGTLLGRPAYGNAQMDGVINATQENYMLLFGDIRAAYTIVDRIGLVVERVDHLFGAANRLPTGQRALYCYWRNGARVVDSGAVGLLNVT